MSIISSCPRCAKQVTVPSGSAPSDHVRCPLCQEQYTLDEALAGAPPMLILVSSLSVVGGEESAEPSLHDDLVHDDPMHDDAVHQEAVHDEEPRRGDAGLHLADTDLHLFSRGMSEMPPAPTIDLTSAAGFADEPGASEEELQEFDLDLAEAAQDGPSFEEPAAVEIDHSAQPVEFDDAPGSDLSDRDTEFETLDLAAAAAAPGDAETVQFDSPSVPFEMSDEDQVRIDGAEDEAYDDDPLGEDSVLSVHAMRTGADSQEPAEESFGFSESEEGPEMALAGGPPEDGAEATPTLTTSPRKQRRKTSLIALLIIYSSSLVAAVLIAYPILLWGFNSDPIGIAPKLPAFLVPKSLANPNARAAAPAVNPGANQLAQAPKTTNPDELPGFESNVPQMKPKPAAGSKTESPADATDEDADAPANDSGSEPADGDDMAADAGAGDDSMSADEAPAEDAADDDVPAKPAKPAKPVRGKPAVAAVAAADEDADSEPAEKETTAADNADDTAMDEDSKPSADEMADDTTDSPDTAADAADSNVADVSGSDVTAPEEADTPAVVVGPRDNVRYALDDVDHALTDVRDAAKAMAKADKDELKKLKSGYYRKLYALAEVATFADNQDADPRAAKQQADVHKVLAAAAADPNRFTEIGKAAGKWMSISKGKEHQGIVLSGAVQGMSKKGDVFETKILLPDGAQSITVLSPLKLPLSKDEQVVVLGSIVSDPATSVEGYQGDETAAVWSGLVLNVADAGAGR